jgi:hypothetical protein
MPSRISLALHAGYDHPMAKHNEHGRLIAAAAKAALAPLGCKRVGQSRCWISDERYWLIVIEFQPSAWEIGSYLNVGAMWLWHPRKGLAFHAGHRVADFVPFKSGDQSSPLINNIVARAAEEVLSIRQKFKSLADIHRHLMNDLSGDGPPIYRAAVTAALLGDVATSRDLFRRIQHWSTDGYDWQEKIKIDSMALVSLLDEPRHFRAAIVEAIQECRALNKLPPDPNCLEVTNSDVERR